MNYTKEQIEKMADEYANQFIDGRDHFYGFKAGFEKALSLFAVSGQLLFSPDDIERIVNAKSMFNGKQFRKMFEEK